MYENHHRGVHPDSYSDSNSTRSRRSLGPCQSANVCFSFPHNYIGRRRNQFAKKTFNFFPRFSCVLPVMASNTLFLVFVRQLSFGCAADLLCLFWAFARDVVLFKWVMQIRRCEQLAQFVRIQTLWAIPVSHRIEGVSNLVALRGNVLFFLLRFDARLRRYECIFARSMCNYLRFKWYSCGEIHQWKFNKNCY